jgi:hypothetical protein
MDDWTVERPDCEGVEPADSDSPVVDAPATDGPVAAVPEVPPACPVGDSAAGIPEPALDEAESGSVFDDPEPPEAGVAAPDASGADLADPAPDSGAADPVRLLATAPGVETAAPVSRADPVE